MQKVGWIRSTVSDPIKSIQIIARLIRLQTTKEIMFNKCTGDICFTCHSDNDIQDTAREIYNKIKKPDIDTLLGAIKLLPVTTDTDLTGEQQLLKALSELAKSKLYPCAFAVSSSTSSQIKKLIDLYGIRTDNGFYFLGKPLLESESAIIPEHAIIVLAGLDFFSEPSQAIVGVIIHV